jgi:hypothetical protein
MLIIVRLVWEGRVLLRDQRVCNRKIVYGNPAVCDYRVNLRLHLYPCNDTMDLVRWELIELDH